MKTGGVRTARLTTLLFLAVVASIPVQYFIAARFGEPYPSLMMPSFAGDNTQHGIIYGSNADVHVETCDGREAVLTPDQLLDPMPGSEVMGAMEWMFGARPHTPLKVPPWKRWVFAHVSPGYAKRTLRTHGETFIDEATKRWLVPTVQKHLHGSVPKTVTIRWYREAYELDPGPTVRSRQVRATTPVQLTCG